MGETLTITSMPRYMAPDESRVSDDVERFTPVPTPEFNDNPRVVENYTEISDPIRDLDFDPNRTRRGYIAWFLNPFQHWQSDRFASGKVMTGKQTATTFDGGMIPDTAQRANIPTTRTSSYGDLLTASTDGVGVDPYSGW